DGTPIGAAVRADTSGHVFTPALSPDTRGGFIGAWQWIISSQEYSFFTRRFDGTGTGVGDDFEVSLEQHGAVTHGSVLGLPAGAVYVCGQIGFWGALYDTQGALVGAPFQIGTGGYYNDVALLPDGGFVVVWSDGNSVSKGRVYDAAAQPRGPEFTLSTDV